MPIPVDVMLNMNLYVDYQTLDQELLEELFFEVDDPCDNVAHWLGKMLKN